MRSLKSSLSVRLTKNAQFLVEQPSTRHGEVVVTVLSQQL